MSVEKGLFCLKGQRKLLLEVAFWTDFERVVVFVRVKKEERTFQECANSLK